MFPVLRQAQSAERKRQVGSSSIATVHNGLSAKKSHRSYSDITEDLQHSPSHSLSCPGYLGRNAEANSYTSGTRDGKPSYVDVNCWKKKKRNACGRSKVATLAYLTAM